MGSTNRARIAGDLKTMRIHIAVLLTIILAPLSAIADPEFFDERPMSGKGYPFSESVRVGNILFISGQVGVDENNELVEGGIVGETRQIMSNIGGALERRGLGFSDVVKCTVFLADVAEWGEFNTIYTTYFEPPYPARSALGANGLALGARLEVECIAAYPSE
jgi:2-iminobutanoate/2-iminopropanoate deaminase